jgi:hypothetical protein
MFKHSVPNRVNDPATGGVICFMAARKLSPQEIKLYLSAYLRNGNTFPPPGVEVTTEILVDDCSFDTAFLPRGLSRLSTPRHA